MECDHALKTVVENELLLTLKAFVKYSPRSSSRVSRAFERGLAAPRVFCSVRAFGAAGLVPERVLPTDVVECVVASARRIRV